MTARLDVTSAGFPDEILLDGVVDPDTGVEYVGCAVRKQGDKYHCLAKVDSALCWVEMTIRTEDST